MAHPLWYINVNLGFTRSIQQIAKQQVKEK
jgi:hypothetical protein